MLKRPKPGEDEDDLLAQQENFLKTVDLNNIGVTVVKKYDEKNSKKIEDENKNVLSDIIEKNLKTENFTFQFSTVSDSCATGFPSISGRSTDGKCQKAKGRSIFMQNFSRKIDDSKQKFDDSKKRKDPEHIKNTDANYDSDLIKLKCQIHQENVQKLKGMSEQEIIEEQAKLIKTLDPKLIEFIKSRRRPDGEKELPANKKDDAIGEEALKNFSHLRNTEWLHMDVEEPEKFSWMSQLPDSLPKVEDTSTPRFDLEGRLMTSEDILTHVSKGLHHHSDDAQLPGYTIEEILPLCRSALLAQKLLAYKVLAKISRLAKSGVYNDLCDKILSKVINLEVCVITRYGLDDSAEQVVVGACSFLAAILDQPSKEFIRLEDDAKFDFNDDEFCRTDLIAALLHMNILDRLRYILEIIRPKSWISLENILIILFEIARRCKTSCEEIFKCNRLICVISDVFSQKIPEISNLDRCRYRAINLLSVLLSCDAQMAKEMIEKFNLRKIDPFCS